MENSEIMEPTVVGVTCIPFSKSYLFHKIRNMLEATWSKEWQESTKGSHTEVFQTSIGCFVPPDGSSTARVDSNSHWTL